MNDLVVAQMLEGMVPTVTAKIHAQVTKELDVLVTPVFIASLDHYLQLLQPSVRLLLIRA